ncbi:type IV pilus biogenesis/stability protein PilW [Janthinobacterium sp. RB2P8]|uniref:type IV pilus biogenesis/stability protein PilW n=1 Tax=Janthinobacterium sp. RB2P8 TaxID=3424191 RepID=UPI003F299CEA
MAYQRSLAVAAVCLAVLLVGCASASSARRATAAGQDASADERAALRLQLASAYYAQGQLDVALAEAEQAVQLARNDAQAYGMRALILAARRQTAPAEKDFLYALRLAPHNPELSNNYGLFLCQTGRAAQSLAYFDAALADAAYVSPEKALNNGGACSLALHDYPRAGAYLMRAVRIAPDVAVTNAGLVRVYYQQQDYRQAAHYLQRLGKIATMESQTADVLWLGIKVQHKLGDAGAEAGLVAHLRNHHSGSPEYAAYQNGAFDE